MPAERILIVDDDRDVRESMGEYLEGHGYVVTLAENGEAMRKALAAAVPDVVLLDLKLPGEDGLSLARWLRENHDLAIIMVTAAAEDIPGALIAELTEDGVMVLPLGPHAGPQRIVKLTRTRDGIARQDLIWVRFVPLLPGQAREL